jgi:WD40 repeat protein
VTYLIGDTQFFPVGKRLLAAGIEAGHGSRDYIIDVGSGDSKPLTPEGILGVRISPDGKSIAVRGPEGKIGIWPLEGGEFHPIPGLESSYSIRGWTADGESLNLSPKRSGALSLRSAKVFRANVQTGKIELWKTFGEQTGAGVSSVSPPHLSSDGTGYAYLYIRVLSEAYVITGLN